MAIFCGHYGTTFVCLVQKTVWMVPPGIGREAEGVTDFLLNRTGSAGFADLNGVVVAALHGDGEADLVGQDFADGFPRVGDAMRLEPHAHGVDDAIGDQADEQMAFDPALDLVVDRLQAEIGLERPEDCFDIP